MSCYGLSHFPENLRKVDLGLGYTDLACLHISTLRRGNAGLPYTLGRGNGYTFPGHGFSVRCAQLTHGVCQL